MWSRFNGIVINEFFNEKSHHSGQQRWRRRIYIIYPKEKYNQYAAKKFLLANLIVALGGRAAEVYMTRKKRNETSFDDIVFRGFKDLDITTGATNDLYQANTIARNYVIQYGFSDSFGLYDQMMNTNLPL